MIAEQYIKEGIRIRKVYVHNLKSILELEPKILNRRSEFEKIQEQMANVVDSDLNEIRKALELDTKLLELDKEIKKVQKMVQPYYDTIEKLRYDTDKLYLAIKEKYPNITPAEIEKEIMSRVEE